MPIITLQQRIREVGRIRLGDKGSKGEPRKLTTFRFTSFDKRAIEAAAELFGGECKPCTTKDLEGQFEVISNAAEIPIMASAVDPSQYMELWSGGGCQRRCDGHTELLSGKPCMCEAGNEECKPTTRLPVILPDLPGLGVWRLESKGWNTASELVQSFELLRSLSGRVMAEGILAIEERRGKHDGKTVRFMVPVIRIGQTPRAMLALRPVEGGLNSAPAALPGSAPALEPSNGSAHEGEGHVLKQPNPRGAAFALLHELGLPAHENGHKAMYYEVFGKVLSCKLESLADIADDGWQIIVTWLLKVRDGQLKMPKVFQDAKANEEHDPFADPEQAELVEVPA